MTTITRNLSIVERTIKFPPQQGRQILFVTFVGGGDTKHLTVDIEGKVIFVIILEPVLKAKSIPDKTNFLVDCGATNHIITDKSKFINFDQNLEPGNHFVELADSRRTNNIVMKKGDDCINLHNSKGHMWRCILKNAL